MLAKQVDGGFRPGKLAIKQWLSEDKTVLVKWFGFDEYFYAGKVWVKKGA